MFKGLGVLGFRVLGFGVSGLGVIFTQGNLGRYDVGNHLGPTINPIVPLEQIKYGFGYTVVRSPYTPYTPYSIYLRGTITPRSASA